MSLIQKWNNFCAQKYIRKFQKYLPYLNLKEEVSKQMALENQFKLVDEILGENRENFVEEVLQKDVRFTEYIIERYLKQNPNYEYHLTQDCLLENSCNYFEDEGVREEVIQYILSNSQLLKRILFSETCDREFLIKELFYEYPELGKDLVLWYLKQNVEYEWELTKRFISSSFKLCMNDAKISNDIRITRDKLINDLCKCRTFLLGGISHCIYNSEQQILMVDGWYLPKKNYDVIQLYINNDLVGQAACGIKRIDVYQNYTLFNEKYAGFKLTTKYDKKITDKDKLEIYVLKNGEVVKKDTPKIIFSNSDMGGIINVENTPEHLIEIYHNDMMVDFINLNELRNIKNLFVPLDNAVRKTKEVGWKVRRLLNHIVEKEVPLRSQTQYSNNFDEQDELLKSAKENISFYKNYLTGPNYFRVHSDYKFLQPYISKTMKILNIGAVPPLLESMIIKGEYGSLTILDPNADHYQEYFKQHQIDYYSGDIFTITQDDILDTFDMVIFAEVIEHLGGNLLEVLSKVTRLVSDNGYLYITTPNLRSISGVYGLCVHSSGLASKYRDTVIAQHKRYEESGYFGHLREYTEKEICCLFSNYGFELIEQFLMPEFRQENSLIIALEELYPEWGLFGKYLFRKHKNDLIREGGNTK